MTVQTPPLAALNTGDIDIADTGQGVVLSLGMFDGAVASLALSDAESMELGERLIAIAIGRQLAGLAGIRAQAAE